MENQKQSSGGKRFGYLVSILVNFFVMYCANNLLNWNVPFLTNRFIECLWAINLSISASIFINCIFLFYDPKWFQSLMQALANVFSFISTYVFWRVFPLDLSESMARIVNVVILIILGLVLLSILIELGNAVRKYHHQ